MTKEGTLFTHTNPRVAELLEYSGTLTDLRSMAALLDWDQSVMMPKGADASRAAHAETLARILHEKQTEPRIGDLLKVLEALHELDPERLTLHDRALIREMRRAYDRETKLSSRLVGDLASATARGFAIWEEARAHSDFSQFRDALQRIVDLKIEVAHAVGFEGTPYNALLDEYEPGLTANDAEAMFTSLRAALVPLVAKYSRIAVDDAFLYRSVSPEVQEGWCRMALDAMEFRFDIGRLDESTHPFTTSFDLTDVRITTRYHEPGFLMSFWSALHEGGHGLYEQGIDPRLSRTALCGGVSLGIHESQSRFWENCVGHSPAFLCTLLRTLVRPRCEAAPGPEQFMRMVNRVTPGFIRVNADETTYNLHVLLRFEIEKALIEKTLSVRDIPDAWNAKMKEYLGIVPRNDAEGCLQDVHWSSGLIGYFPTYTIGNLFSAQLLNCMRREFSDLDSRVLRLEFAPIRAWLREHIHQHGGTFTPKELIRRVTGEELNPQYFVRYLTDKLTHVFG